MRQEGRADRCQGRVTSVTEATERGAGGDEDERVFMKGGDNQLSPVVWSAALDSILGRYVLMRLKARRELCAMRMNT